MYWYQTGRNFQIPLTLVLFQLIFLHSNRELLSNKDLFPIFLKITKNQEGNQSLKAESKG